MVVSFNNFATNFQKFLILLIFIKLNLLKTIEIQSRITHGHPTQSGQFPWFVIIKEAGYTNVHCAGSLISAAWVITAGHCLYKKPALRFYFGSNILRNPTALTMWSQQFYVCPDYSDITFDNDVGLVKLPQPVTLSATIQPIALISRSMAANSLVGTNALIVGLGLTSDEVPNSYPTNSFFASVKIISSEECKRKVTFPLPINSICSEGATQANEKICDGDSGGGLVAHSPDGKIVLIGINSFGSQKCTQKPSGYANIGLFLDWIQNITNIPLQ